MFVICFISQWMKRTKHGLFVFPPKKTLIWRRHCSIDQSCCSMTSKQLLESSSGMKFFSAERLLNQPKARCVCFRSINQSNRFISVRLLFLCCSRVFLSRSYEYRSICSEDDWRSRIFGAFLVKFLFCLPLLGFSNI